MKEAINGIPSVLSRLGGSFVLYAIVTAVFFWTLQPYLNSALLGPPEDNLQDLWNSWYAAVGHTKGSGFFFTDLIKFPEGTTLYYHSIAYPQVFLVWLGTKFFGTSLPTVLLLQNLVILLSFPLAGTGAFCLAYHLTRNTWGALLGGFVFAFNPSHVEHAMHHLHVASIQFIPFFVLSYLLALEKKSTAWLAIAVVFYALSALSCWYYLFYCGYFLAFHTIYHWVKNQTPPRGWTLYAPFAAIGGVLLALSPWLVPMVREAAMGGNVYTERNDTYMYVADVVAYVSFPPRHIFGTLTKPLYHHFTGNAWESHGLSRDSQYRPSGLVIYQPASIRSAIGRISCRWHRRLCDVRKRLDPTFSRARRFSHAGSPTFRCSIFSQCTNTLSGDRLRVPVFSCGREYGYSTLDPTKREKSDVKRHRRHGSPGFDRC